VTYADPRPDRVPLVEVLGRVSLLAYPQGDRAEDDAAAVDVGELLVADRQATPLLVVAEDPFADVLSVTGSVQPLGQVYLHVVTIVLADGLTDKGSDRELVSAVAQGHERSGEWVPVDGAGDLDQAASSEDLC